MIITPEVPYMQYPKIIFSKPEYIKTVVDLFNIEQTLKSDKDWRDFSF